MDKRIDKLRREISTRESQILAIQKQCEHVGAIKIARECKGDWYSGGEDDHWNECYCGECGKSWTEDQ